MSEMFIYILFGVLLLFVLGVFFYFYNALALTNGLVVELSDLVARTFREYYKGQDIEPVVINSGIDLVWSGDVDGNFEDNKIGFITILTKDAGVNSPINNHKEADILAGKISHVVYEYIKERDGSL